MLPQFFTIREHALCLRRGKSNHDFFRSEKQIVQKKKSFGIFLTKLPTKHKLLWNVSNIRSHPVVKRRFTEDNQQIKIKFWPVWPQKQICNNELDWFTTTALPSSRYSVNMLRKKGAPDSPLSWC